MSKEKSFEEKLDDAKVLLEKLKDPEITIKDAIEIYKKGKKELKEASKILENAQLKFEELSKDTI